MEKEMFECLGKNTQKRLIKGELTEQMAVQIYKRLKREADDYPEYGLSYSEMMLDLRVCKNPILARKIRCQIEEYKQKRDLSTEQNKRSIAILAEMCENACGIGLRALKDNLKIRSRNSLADMIIYKLLCLEWTNLAAKKYSVKSKRIYKYKEQLLLELEPLLARTGWTYGVSDKTGKNASGIVFIYLPNGCQLSWHCSYRMFQEYPAIDVKWDGMTCSTLTKIVDYVQSRNNISANAA